MVLHGSQEPSAAKPPLQTLLKAPEQEVGRGSAAQNEAYNYITNSSAPTGERYFPSHLPRQRRKPDPPASLSLPGCKFLPITRTWEGSESGV